MFRFRVVRDAELEIEGRDTTISETRCAAGVRRRRFGAPVCIQLESDAPEEILDDLVVRLDLYREDLFVAGGPLGLGDLAGLLELDRPDLKDPVLVQRVPRRCAARRIYLPRFGRATCSFTTRTSRSRRSTTS